MIFHQGVKVAQWFGGILAALAIVLAACFWLLSQGPISLDWLAPLVARSLTRAEPGLVASIDHTRVRLAQGPRLKIMAKGIHLTRTDGKAALYLPSLTLSLSPQAMLEGKIAPQRIEITGARIHLLRTADGAFHIGIAGEQPGTGDWAEALLRGLAQPPNQRGAFGHLSRVAVRDASLDVEDRKLDATWQATGLDATLVRTKDGIAGDLSLTIGRGRTNATIHGYLLDSGTPRRLSVKVNFHDLRPAVFAPATRVLQPLAALELPLAGEAGMTLDADARRITGFWCNVKLGKGHIVDPKLAGGALTVIKGALSMAFNGKTKALQLRHFAATLDEPDGPKLDLTATIKDFDPEAVRPLAFSGDLQVHDLKASDFPKLWPRAVTAKARAWILKHILKGEIDHTDIRLAGTIVPNGQHGMMAHIGKVAGRFSFHGASVNYFDPLAPVDDIDGTARFDRKHMDILPDGGISRDVKVSDAAIHLTELNTNHEQAAIAVKLSGPLSTILDELNKKPLGYARALGIDPAHVAGTAIAHVQFHLPMKMDLNFSQVRYAAQGRLDNVAVERVFFNRDLSAGNLRLDVVPGRLKIDGTAKLQGVPVALAWTERFGDGGLRTRYHLHGRFDDAARRRLGIGVLPNHIRGPIGVDLTFLRKRSGNADSHVTLDLGPTALTLERLGWTKKSGQPATASFDIRARKGLPTRITNIRLDGGGLEARADIKMTGSSVDAGIARIDVRHLRVGRNDLHGVITRRPRGWAIWATGNSFDAAPLFDELQAARPNRVRDPRLWITANLGRVYLAPDRVATAVRARLYSDGWHWKSASIDARTAPGDMLRLRFGTAGKTPQFHLSTNNLGALLRLLDISNKVRGGHLSVIGHAEDLGNRRVLRGRFVGKDYRVIDVPAFARLLSAASLTGAAALLSGEGIPFSRVEGNFVMADGAVELSNARAFGEAIGINASGLFDYRDQRINLTGTIVPAYLFNSFLSNIPVLGNLLLGGKGEGIFAANYRVAGPMANPGISVNPLSALAPGFLRRLFLFAPGTPDTNDAGRNAAPKGG